MMIAACSSGGFGGLRRGGSLFRCQVWLFQRRGYCCRSVHGSGGHGCPAWPCQQTPWVFDTKRCCGLLDRPCGDNNRRCWEFAKLDPGEFTCLCQLKALARPGFATYSFAIDQHYLNNCCRKHVHVGNPVADAHGCNWRFNINGPVL